MYTFAIFGKTHTARFTEANAGRNTDGSANTSAFSLKIEGRNFCFLYSIKPERFSKYFKFKVLNFGKNSNFYSKNGHLYNCIYLPYNCKARQYSYICRPSACKTCWYYCIHNSYSYSTDSYMY